MLNDYAREQMVSQQVRAWDVLDEEVLEVMRAVPRELFVPPESRALAFADIGIALPGGHRMLPPNIIGRILQSLALRPAGRALEVGTGSGFLGACMARLGAKVRSLEIDPALADFARGNLRAASVMNVEVVTGDGLQLIGDASKYDAIAITASMPLYDPRFEQCLEPGGRLFVVVGEGAAMEARLISRLPDGGFQRTSLFETVLEPLVNAPRREIFTF